MSNKRILAISIIAIALAFGAVGGILLWNQTTKPVSDPAPAYPLNDPTAAPVDLKNGTRILWNGEDITDRLSGEIATDGASFTLIERFADSIDENGGKRPVDGFELIRFGAGSTPDTMLAVGNDTGFFWSSPAPHTTVIFAGESAFELDAQHYTYALDGKTVEEISFSGVDIKYLKTVGDKGLVLNFDTPGKYELSYSVRDSAGCERTGTKFEYSIN